MSVRVQQLAWASAATAALVAPAAWASNAEIVLLIGKGERRQATSAPWRPAAVSQKLQGGESVRTLADSQMALFMPDRTQVRLNQNTELEIKAVGESASWSETLLSLSSGRAWSQARPLGAASSPDRRRVSIQTPTATLGIRGTDWEVEVDRDGRTQLVVLSGVVEMSNAFGAVQVAQGEGAVAERGRAPVKQVLVSPASRVQWVSSWRPQPRRWAGADAQRLAPTVAAIERGDYSTAVAGLRGRAAADAGAAVLLADVLLHQGEAAAARNVLQPHAQGGAGDPRAVALLAQALARDDQLPQGRTLLATALTRTPSDIGLLLAQGDLAVLDGDVAAAQAAYRAVLARDADNAAAWYGLGLIESERENVRAARAALGEALKRDPAAGAASAELAATEAFAGNLAEGRRLLLELLAREPDNYQALTALGLNRLKSGQSEEALQDFMKAGVIEPRYARAWLYSGIAFYQRGEPARATEALRKAAQLDARDPMPWLYRSVADGDALAYGDAIESARQAQQRMPYLKSLNQAASNQKGSANLGSALANFGMEEWASYYAIEAYSPYWGGSHLFLADRYTGLFNKNSELFKGFLTEPTAFGASNRFSSLVAAPGNYGKVDASWDRGVTDQPSAALTLNGTTVEPIPIAYFINGILGRSASRDNDSTQDFRIATLGLGARPRHDIGVFTFVTDSKFDGTVRYPILPNDPIKQTDRRADIGLNFKLSAENQFWLKGGAGEQLNQVRGPLVSQDLADSLNRLLSIKSVTPNGLLDRFDGRTEQTDFQFRHTFSADAMQWSWGLEHSSLNRSRDQSVTFAPARIAIGEEYTVRQDDAYLSALYRSPGRFDAQADLFYQRARLSQSTASTLQVGPQMFDVGTPRENVDVSQWNPRFGLRWQLAPMQSLRLALQKWRRPASSGTLSPVDTVGIPVTDKLLLAGGLYQRGRIQFDGELGSTDFVRAFIDHEEVDNGIGAKRGGLFEFDVTELQTLRVQPDVFSARSDLEEIPDFAKGRVRTLGAAYNRLIGKRQSLSARYLYREGRQTGANAGLDVPYIPRHMLQLGYQMAPAAHWLVGASAVYRSSRFRDESNLTQLNPSWSFGFTVYWESADKRSAVHGIVDNLLTDRAGGFKPDPHVLLRYSYRF